MDKYIVMIILVIIVILFLYNKQENITSDSGKTLSDEAIQTIASVYNTQNMVVTNLNVTGWKGIIVAWYGKTDAVPKGWGLCDGTNGTPDLRGRFILGFGKGENLTERKMDDKGGSENHILTIDEIPKHQHRLPVSGSVTDKIEPTMMAGINTYYRGGWITDFEGGDKPHNNMPPYYTLAYIMKL